MQFMRVCEMHSVVMLSNKLDLAKGQLWTSPTNDKQFTLDTLNNKSTEIRYELLYIEHNIYNYTVQSKAPKLLLLPILVCIRYWFFITSSKIRAQHSSDSILLLVVIMNIFLDLHYEYVCSRSLKKIYRELINKKVNVLIKCEIHGFRIIKENKWHFNANQFRYNKDKR